MTAPSVPDVQAAFVPASPRRVLMVLYHFPPLGGVSMPRNVRNAQYLPGHGWTPVVLTPRHPAAELRDPSSLDLLPANLAVVRTGSIEAGHVRALAVRLGDLVAAPQSGDSPTPKPSSARIGASLGGGRIRRLLFFPDNQVGWLPFGLAAALRAHRSAPFTAVYSTSSPITSHLVAGAFKRLTGVPWVAEFRDPWLGNVLAARLPWFQRRLQLKLERWIVRTADRVICVTPTLTRMYQERYPDAEIGLITNGYDRSEAVVRERSRGPRERFRIVYTGTLDRPAELEVFLAGLERLVVRSPELRERLEVVFYGLASDSCRAVALRFVNEGHLAGIVRIAGLVARGAALSAVADADAALVLLGPAPGMELFIGGKLYDYLGQGRQILAMVPPGDAREVLRGLDWGIVADPTPEGVEGALERLVTEPAPAGPADPSGRYDRATLAGQLAAVLADVSPAPARSSSGSLE